jgi:hypothetical protein
MRMYPVRRRVLAATLCAAVAATIAACGGTETARRSEGDQVFRAGQAAAPPAVQFVVNPGAPLARVGLLIPTTDPAWQTSWVDQRQDDSSKATRAAQAGVLTGLMVLQAAPIAIVAWPVAVGVGAASLLAGGTAATAVASGAPMMPTWLSPPDEAAIATATNQMQANRLARSAFAEGLRARMGGPVETIDIMEPVGPEGPRSEWLNAAAAQGLDGLVDIRVEGVGLSAGDTVETFGAFTQIRVRAFEVRGGRLRYERVMGYGPAQPAGNLPPVSTYSMGLMAGDGARVYRFEAAQAIDRLSRALATDPALPILRR